MITSKVRKRIQDLSSDYYARLQIIETKARQLLEFSQAGSHITFTPHGLSHISAVERNYDWLLPDSDLHSFNSSELFCLICATFFHDALMIPHKQGDEPDAREHHTQRAHDFLIKNRDLLALSIHEVDAIAQVIRAHHVYDLTEIPDRVILGPEIVDLRKLGACLSLADISHADSSRAPEIVFKHLELNEDSRFHWRRHLQISGITREEDAILMSALTFSSDGSKAVEDYKEAIEQQLKIVRPYFDTVLKPIKRVELTDRRLESPLDQTLQFQTNTPAILKLLIDGVYEREDVFIRELVQNSLDSCLLRRAKQQRRNVVYEPQILLTTFYERGQFKAFRIDDNGIGMDLNDVQDTVLWIGNSISSRDDITALLQQTLRKNLIATFGIGLLSCFKASSNITVRTQKENETPLQFKLTGVSDSVKPERSSDRSIGTSIIVELSDTKANEIDPEEAVDYYFRYVKQVSLKTLSLEWSQQLAATSREELFRIALTESEPVKGEPYSWSKESHIGFDIFGEDFNGSIWFEKGNFKSLVDYEGSVDILNEGIFVVNEPTTEWFPNYMSFCNAVLNFSSKAISLPAGRDRVIKDERFRSKAKELTDKSFSLIEELVRHTNSKDGRERDFAALVLASIYSKSDKDSRERMLKRMDDYRVRRYKREDRLSLQELMNTPAQTIYIQYTKGRWVQELTVVDGKQLYHKEDDFVELQAAMMAQGNHPVISTVREDTDQAYLEADLIKAYFKKAKIKVVDLTQDNVLEGKYRSKPVPSSVRQEVGPITKFIEVSGLPNKKAWRVGNELWINLANPTMRSVYDTLQKDILEPEVLRLTLILLSLMSYHLDDASRKIASWLEEYSSMTASRDFLS